jgi:8-oxo-dGTP pyrophosphatase MutT (NUDIX family)
MKKKNNQVQPIEAAGGVLYRINKNKVEILLIYRNDVWDLPKGKIEDDESYEECALREVSEEVGLVNLELTGYLTDTYHEYTENGIKLGKSTKWYSIATDHPNEDPIPQYEEGITRVLWKELDQAKSMVGYENLVKVISIFEEKKAWLF